MLLEKLAENPKGAMTATAATTGSGLYSTLVEISNWVSVIVGPVAAVLGLIVSILLARYYWVKTKRETLEHTRMIEEKLDDD